MASTQLDSFSFFEHEDKGATAAQMSFVKGITDVSGNFRAMNLLKRDAAKYILLVLFIILLLFQASFNGDSNILWESPASDVGSFIRVCRAGYRAFIVIRRLRKLCSAMTMISDSVRHLGKFTHCRRHSFSTRKMRRRRVRVF